MPEFVIAELQYPDMYNFIEDRSNDEYVVPISRFYPLENLNTFRRRRIERQLKGFGEKNISVRSIDLKERHNSQLLIDTAELWWSKNLNDFGKIGLEAMKKSILNAGALDVGNVCIFAGENLVGFCLYLMPVDERYIILAHIKATHKDTIGFDLIGYLIAQWFSERNCICGNLTQDWGRLRLRMFLMTLGPVNYFRKYTIYAGSIGLCLQACIEKCFYIATYPE